MAKTKVGSYRERISISTEKLEAVAIESNIQQAELAMKMGLLSLESKIATANSVVLEFKNELSNQNNMMDEAKRSDSGNLVQNLINARFGIKQAEANLAAKEADLLDLLDLQTFLKETQTELF